MLEDQFYSRLKAKNLEMFREFDQNAPEELFHYTSGLGLIGILSSRLENQRTGGAIWASDVRCLNDLSEFSYSVTLLKDALRGGRRTFVSERLLEVCEQEGDFRLGSDWFAHVACFCEAGDLLSQWRGYSKLRDGYAVGFRLDRLVQMSRDTPNEFGLFRVMYNRAEQLAALASFLSYVEHLWDNSRPSGAKANHLLAYISEILLGILLRFKHPTFAEEREWRILVINPSPLLFRAVCGTIVPYTTVHFDGDLIGRVVTGPNSGRLQNAENIRRLLRNCGCPDVVAQSDIPFSSL